MNVLKTKGIVVRTTDYKEYDRLITLITDTLGKITVQMKGCRRPTAKLRHASVPMFFGEYILNETAGRYIVTGCDSIEPFYDVSTDVDCYYCACAIMQIAERISQDGEDTLDTLSILLKHLIMLKDRTSPHYEVLIRFVDELTRVGGYSVGMTTCRYCGRDIEVGALSDEGMSCQDCNTYNYANTRVDANIIDYVREVLSGLEHAHVVSHSLVRQALEFVQDYQKRLLGIKLPAYEEYLKVFNL